MHSEAPKNKFYYGNVSLEVSGKIHVDEVFVFPFGRRGGVEIKMFVRWPALLRSFCWVVELCEGKGQTYW